MENAAKALLIAGGVLIGMLILTVAVYFYRAMGANVTRIREDMDKVSIAEFNQVYLNYDNRGYGGPGDKPLSSQDIATLINMVNDQNEHPKQPTSIIIIYNGTTINKDASNGNFISVNTLNWLNNDRQDAINGPYNITTGMYQNAKEYKCKVNVNPSTLLVYEIIIDNI